jgi:hypothetical protein
MLKPIVYQHSGKYLGYGLKFWPAKVDELIDNEDRFEWVRNLYK